MRIKATKSKRIGDLELSESCEIETERTDSLIGETVGELLTILRHPADEAEALATIPEFSASNPVTIG